MSQEISANRVASVKSLLTADAYRKRFEEILGARAPQFTASVINASQSPQLAKCEPRSVIAAAMVAATLDLPVDRNLGFAHLVPYRGKDGVQVAQFQLGYKALVQLALRSGQYQRMNATKVNAEAFGGYDDVGEPVIRWEQLDDTKTPVGYAFAWKLINGFVKVVYWSKAKVEAHAQRFSQAVRGNKQDSPWFTDFDAMAMKTVIKTGLSHWGILSIQMERALRHDQGAQRDVDSDVDYIDMSSGESGETTQERPAVPEKQKGVAAMRSLENQQPQSQPESSDAFEEPPQVATPPDPEPAKEPAKPASTPPRRPGRPPKERAENPAADPQSETAPSSGSSPEYSAPAGNKEAAGSAALGSVTAPAASTPEANEARPWPRTGVALIRLPNDGIVTKNPNLGFKEHTLPDSGEVVRLIKRCVIESAIFNGTAFYTGRDPAIVELLDSGDAIEVTLSLQPNANANRPPNVIIESAARLGETPEI